jgi:hypothetical protein
MKKIMIFAAFIGCAMFFVSCDNKEKTETKKVINTYHDAYAGDFTYYYDIDGRVTSISRVEDWGEGPNESTYTFTYNGTTVTVNENNSLWATLTLGENGYVSRMVKGSDDCSYTYNNGYLTGVTYGGAPYSVVAYTNNNMVTWTKEDSDSVSVKTHTYKDSDNRGGIFSAFCERAADGKRWLCETGLFGKASAKLCATAKWDYSQNVGTHEYLVDESGYVTKDTYYGNEVYEYAWKDITVNKK